MSILENLRESYILYYLIKDLYQAVVKKTSCQSQSHLIDTQKIQRRKLDDAEMQILQQL